MSKGGKNKLSQEQLLQALRKKRECNARALVVVEKLLDRHNNSDDFLSMISEINQCHYDDIVDERHILQLCGYPLCNRDVDKVPVKKYQISTATNKVYDITDRKKFCSTQCFKSSEYIKSQMLTSPLWLRNHETIPKFQLLDISYKVTEKEPPNN